MVELCLSFLYVLRHPFILLFYSYEPLIVFVFVKFVLETLFTDGVHVDVAELSFTEAKLADLLILHVLLPLHYFLHDKVFLLT
jgi:hypothetical protein